MKRRTFISALAGSCCALGISSCGMNHANAAASLTVEASLCKGCGLCATVCKGDAISLIANKADIDLAKCIRCGNCVKVCPYDAIY